MKIVASSKQFQKMVTAADSAIISSLVLFSANAMQQLQTLGGTFIVLHAR